MQKESRTAMAKKQQPKVERERESGKIAKHKMLVGFIKTKQKKNTKHKHKRIKAIDSFVF